LQAAFEDEENEDVLAAAFDDSDEVAIVEGADGLTKKLLKPLNKGSITDKEFYKAM
jgi:hypothetical protein